MKVGRREFVRLESIMVAYSVVIKMCIWIYIAGPLTRKKDFLSSKKMKRKKVLWGCDRIFAQEVVNGDTNTLMDSISNRVVCSTFLCRGSLRSSLVG